MGAGAEPGAARARNRRHQLVGGLAGPREDARRSGPSAWAEPSSPSAHAASRWVSPRLSSRAASSTGAADAIRRMPIA